jgi:hypothetical protein
MMRSVAIRAALVAVWCFVCFNLNGRELGSYDSQPPKFLAREILLRHTLTLDATVAEVPAYRERPGFVRAADGHYRSAYSIVPALAAAAVGWPLNALRVVDLDGPLSPNLLAKLTASLLSTLAVLFAFLTARRYATDGVATLVAVAFGLGTNVWALASQTLWQHESVLAGLTLALYYLARAMPISRKGDGPSRLAGGERVGAKGVQGRMQYLHPFNLLIASAGLGIAGWARPQVAPAIAVLAAYLITRRGRARNLFALVPLATCAALALALNMRWFAHPLGAVPLLEALHPVYHAVDGSIAPDPLGGALGLLFSPSRGLVVFSPIVLVTLLSLPRAWHEGWHGLLIWCWLAAIGQFALYAGYSVWWGGHTYGPRYLIDLLPLLVPLAAAGTMVLVRTRAGVLAGAVALGWSLMVAATGAWCYPAEAWNTDPISVNQHHERLWDWKDPQFVRCWRRGSSPQNFDFLERGAFTARQRSSPTMNDRDAQLPR